MKRSIPGSPTSSPTRATRTVATAHGGGPAVRLTPEVAAALAGNHPVVGLESSVLAQGLPPPHNAEAARRMMSAIRAAGAEPAITAVMRGTPVVGLLPDELTTLLAREGVLKASARDLPVAMAGGRDVATTVAGALCLCRLAGVQVFATGGIGGVHRGAPFDESADLLELSRTPMVVVSAGAKSILDLPATVERLETLGVTVAGYRTHEFPGFFSASSGIPVPVTVDGPEEIAAILRAQRWLGRPAAVLVVQPPPADVALDPEIVDDAVAAARQAARREGVSGSATTPFLLEEVARVTGGRSIVTNLALLESNAALAAAVAVCLTRAPDS